MSAARPERANELYERVRTRLGAQGGAFGAHMHVDLVNDGEFGKIGGFSGYPRQRLSGLEMRTFPPGT